MQCSVDGTAEPGKNKEPCQSHASMHSQGISDAGVRQAVWKMSKGLGIISRDFKLAFSFSSCYSSEDLCLKPIIQHLQEENGIKHLVVSHKTCGNSFLSQHNSRELTFFFWRLKSALRHTPLGHLVKSGSLANACHEGLSLRTTPDAARWPSAHSNQVRGETRQGPHGS